MVIRSVSLVSNSPISLLIVTLPSYNIAVFIALIHPPFIEYAEMLNFCCHFRRGNLCPPPLEYWDV
jgi:hypothetical protein